MSNSSNFQMASEFIPHSATAQESMIKSSTPDGLAPISLEGLYIIVFSICALCIAWGLFNFIKLLRIRPEDNQESMGSASNSSKESQVQEMGQKVLLASMTYAKFNIFIIGGASILFMLLIMGLVEQFDQFSRSVAYLLGVLTAILCSLLIIIASSLSYFRIIYSSQYSSEVAFKASQQTANCIVGICLSILTMVATALTIFNFPSHADHQKPESINLLTNSLISFSFGFVTVCICTKITSVIYSKGIENSFKISHLFEHNLEKNHMHPMVLCKIVGETINYSLSKSLSFLMYYSLTIGFVSKAAGMNVVGTDQQGQIIFDLAAENVHIALLTLSFSLFFNLVMNSFIGQPSTEEQVKRNFTIKFIGVSLFLVGFTALSCYLTLPAEFQILSVIKEGTLAVDSPIYAYLSVILGMTTCSLIGLSAQIMGSRTFFIYSLLKSCKAGAATALISVLSMGYFYTVIPVISLAAFGYLCHFWLGTFGVGMGLVGICMYIPFYLNCNVYHSTMNVSSMMAYVVKCGDDTTSRLFNLNESRKYYTQQIGAFSQCLAVLAAYSAISSSIQFSKLSEFDLSNPKVFTGLLMGSMFPYIISGLLIKNSYRVAPVICFDLQLQVEEDPQIAQGNSTYDFFRANYFYVLNSAMSIIRFLPILLVPNTLMGVLGGVQSTASLTIGMAISSVQISVSSLMIGALSANVRDEISYGKAKDEDMNEIKMDSEWGQASETANAVGSSLKDSSGQSCHVLLFWAICIASVFEEFFLRIHEQ